MDFSRLAPVVPTSLRLHRVSLRLTSPVQAAHGLHAERNVVFVELNEGWGECGAPDNPAYSGESADAAYEALTDVFFPLLHSQFTTREIPLSALDLRALIGEHHPDALVRFPMAVAALEMALLDAQLRADNIDFTQCFTSRATGDALAGATLGNTGSLDELTLSAAVAVREGYGRIKMKIAPNYDIEPIRAVRSALPDHVMLVADANGSYGADDIAHVAALHELGLDLVEQPFAAHDTDTHQALVATATLRVALDEGVRTTEEAMSAALNHECTDITLKPAKFGYPACVRLLNECHEHGIDAWVGGMFDTGVARWANVRLAMHQGATLASDIGSSSRYWESDITTPLETVDGKALISHLAEAGLSGTPLL